MQKAKENPDVPDDVMAALRQEAAQKAAEDLTAQLDAAKKAAAKAEQDKAAAEEAARVAAGKLEEMQKTSKLANPDMMAIQTLAEQMAATWNAIQDHRMKVVATDPKNADPLKRFLTQTLSAMIDSLEQ